MLIALTVILVWTVVLSATGYAAFVSVRDSRMRHRLFENVAPRTAVTEDDEAGFLTRWLELAGYRSPNAAFNFTVITLVLFVVAVLSAFLINRAGLFYNLMATIAGSPGGIFDIFIPVVYAAPWIVLVLITSASWLIVRSARRRRVTQIEQDLPLVLELLSTLSEAGLSFDAALDRVIVGQPQDRPLTRELRTFRAETLSGRPRIQSFRRLSRRVDIPSFSSFISAVVQAEQIGAGIADVLRRQADDNRARRRERAMEMAMTLPVKRLVPLVVCFLPAILLWAVGPSLFQLVEFVDAFTRYRRIR